MKRVPAYLAAVFLATASACGGSDDEAFVNRMDELCGSANEIHEDYGAQFQSIPDTPEAVADFFERQLSELTVVYAEIQALDPPADDAEAFGRLQDQIRDSEEIARNGIDAFRDGDLEEAERIIGLNNDLLAAQQATFAELGLADTECTRVQEAG